MTSAGSARGRRHALIVAILAAFIFLTGVISPPSLMDDVDGAHATIARNMLRSGDWVTPTLDGIKYLDKAPLQFWMIAATYRVFGIHDWAARLPLALLTIVLCWIVALFGNWAFGPPAGLYAGLVITTCVGLFLFTRVLIPDSILTLLVTVAMWGMLRALDDDEKRPWLWSNLAALSMGLSLLVKGLLGPLLLGGGGLLFLLFTKQLFLRHTWRRLHGLTGLVIVLCVSAPWFVLATLRNPPHFVWTLQSGPGHYYGFFWRFFINEHVLRFLNTRYPRDYDTVPLPLFWLLHLIWLFPWSLLGAACFREQFRGPNRAARTRLLAVCWMGFLLVFFSFSTTQEYYAMPGYPALALLLASAMLTTRPSLEWGRRVLGWVSIVGGTAAAVLLAFTVKLPSQGDITSALTNNPNAYTLSMGHMEDLTLQSFAYLRFPLLLAAIALVAGGTCVLRFRQTRSYIAAALMMVLFLQAARIALVRFDPSLSSRQLGEKIYIGNPAQLVLDDEYYTFSSALFYADRNAFILHGRVNNLEYGSWAPAAPPVFLEENQFGALWRGPEKCFVLTTSDHLPRLKGIVGTGKLYLQGVSGDRFLFSNRGN